MNDKTIAELKVLADTLGVKYASKIRKADLIDAIDKAQQVTKNIKQADDATDTFASLPEDSGVVFDETQWVVDNAKKSTHLPNSERVQKYTRARLLNGFANEVGQHALKLTPKQMRRVRKNANKHGEGFTYSSKNIVVGTHTGVYSLLARTPDGLGIFYQFSK